LRTIKNNSLKPAFTLAEVLVTLAIIGVVAALTIPVLLQNTTDNGNYSKWKKTFSSIAQGVKKLEADQETIDFSTDTSFRDDFEKVLVFLKKDTMGNLTAGLIYKLYKSTGSRTFSAEAYPSAILTDGTRIAFDSLSPTCGATQGSLQHICGRIAVDVNGIKPPNIVGKDAFALFIIQRGGTYLVLPMGTSSDGYNCTTGSSLLANSSGCSARVFLNNLP